MTGSAPTSRPRVLVVIGTRPEGIKLAPVVAALEARGEEVEVETALTGQHTDLMDQVLQVFGLRIDAARDLGIMREGQDLYDVAHGCLDGLRRVVRDYRPELVLVQGDTATVFLASLVAFFERTKVGHVEAGLRSHDKWRPYPEEIFRKLTGVLADVHFAPTRGARDNLLREGVPADRVHVTGNTVVDALQRIAGEPREARNEQLARALAEVETGKRMILLTAHRRESFGAPMREAFRAVREIADLFEDVLVLYPVHPNPNVRAAASEQMSDHSRISLTAPLDYFDLVTALQKASLVITDSGGIQEEAPTFGKPVLVLREVTERPEGVEAGIAEITGTDRETIVGLASAILSGGGWPALVDYRRRRRAGRTVRIAI
ncbi:MAG: non-hydrolyzing UDP-N-acetylglucosamine 2-epimerase, partial [Longimicrobiales bacterium]